MSVPVNMGMPTVKTPPPVLAPRRKSRTIRVGSLEVGGDAPITVQSMTTTPTSDINATLQQIAELTAAGCDIVRVAVPTSEDAAALPAIAAKSQIPVVADIHFQPRYVFAAIDAGCAAVRVIARCLPERDGRHQGSEAAGTAARGAHRRRPSEPTLDKRGLQPYRTATTAGMVVVSLWQAPVLDEVFFHDRTACL